MCVLCVCVVVCVLVVCVCVFVRVCVWGGTQASIGVQSSFSSRESSVLQQGCAAPLAYCAQRSYCFAKGGKGSRMLDAVTADRL